jgi:sugar phosphate isomerase/epimerase
VIDFWQSILSSVILKMLLALKFGTWGAEVAVGTGEVNWPHFFEHLKKIGFKGDFSLEREAGNQRIADLSAGRQLAEKLMH